MASQFSPKPKFRHLSIEERESIAISLAQGKSVRAIARELHRNASSISREISINSTPLYQCAYRAHRAQARSKKREKASHSRPRLKTDKIRSYVVSGILKGWTPELISGRLRKRTRDWHICHEAIYQFIYEERRDLISRLPRSHRRRKRRLFMSRKRAIRIPDRVPIGKRPKIAEGRTQAGHWEVDTVVSRASTSSLVVAIERKCRIAKISKMESRNAKDVRKFLTRRLRQIPQSWRRTITYDNGTENVEHAKTNSVLGTKSYFCNPYHSWEKGSVENQIGLIRRFLPKRTDFLKITTSQIRAIERRLNNRPRKCLSYRTPSEVYRKLRCCN